MPTYKNKPNILLDLDNTLICAIETKELDNNPSEMQTKKYNILEKHNLANKYIIFERPYLKQFIKYIFTNFNVSIWTAASDDYMDFIVRKIIKKYEPNGIIHYKFHSEHCRISERQSHNNSTKSIKLLCERPELFNVRRGFFSIDDTFIIDDYYELVIKKNSKNSIQVKNFEYFHTNSHNDNFLNRLTIFFSENKDLIRKGNPYFTEFIIRSKSLLGNSPSTKGSGRLGIKLSRQQLKAYSNRRSKKVSPRKSRKIKSPKFKNNIVSNPYNRNSRKPPSPQIRRGNTRRRSVRKSPRRSRR